MIVIAKLFQIPIYVSSQGTLGHPLPVSALSRSWNRTLGGGPRCQEEIILSAVMLGQAAGHELSSISKSLCSNNKAWAKRLHSVDFWQWMGDIYCTNDIHIGLFSHSFLMSYIPPLALTSSTTLSLLVRQPVSSAHL